MARKIFYTIGTSTHTAEAFTALLKKHKIEVLIDIRTYPGSKRFPHFNQERMRKWLPKQGIEFFAIPKLGGRRPNILGDASPNWGWRHVSFRSYADYALTDEFEEGLAELLKIAKGKRVAYFCCEHSRWQCHRNIVSEYLVSRGYQVRHIESNGVLKPHILLDFGMMQGKKILYPPELAKAVEAKKKVKSAV